MTIMRLLTANPRSFALGMVLAVVSASVIGQLVFRGFERLNNLESAIDDVAGNVSDHEGRVDELRSDVDDHNDQIDQLESQVNELEWRNQ